MFFASRHKQKDDRAILQDNVAYPQATVKEYLNMRRTTKDKCCLVIFTIYMIAVTMITGIGFFYGNYLSINTFVSATGPCEGATKYVNSDFTSCVSTCTGANTLYLQKVCVPQTYNPSFTQKLVSQIQIYNLNSTFSTMLYINVGILVGLIFLFSLLICFQKLVYAYILITFLLLLGFSFYLLKSIDVRIIAQNVLPDTIFYQDEKRMTGLAYTLLASYLIFFPMILFSPRKIKIAVSILSSMYKYFQKMFTLIFLTCFIALLAYGFIFIQAFLLMNIFTDGNQFFDSSSFFYQYEKVYLSHPVALAFLFFGIIWLFGAVISWHKYVVSSSMCQWYFQDSVKLKPVRRGLKRSLFHIGSAAIDSLLTPLEWIILLLYSLTKMNSQTVQKYQNQHPEDCLCFSNSLYKFRMLVNKMYVKINRNSSATGVLTNHTYIESCQIGAVTFSQNNHKFFNIGGNLTLFLTLFSTLIEIFINYIALYYNIFNASYPPPITSLALPIILSASLGIVIGQLMSNIFTSSIDCLLFCYLIQKKNGVEYSQNQIKKALEEIYTQQEQQQEVLEMYQIQTDDN